MGFSAERAKEAFEADFGGLGVWGFRVSGVKEFRALGF